MSSTDEQKTATSTVFVIGATRKLPSMTFRGVTP